MSGADEESSAETANLKSSNTAKKTGKSRKIEKRKPTTTTAPSIRGGGFALGGLSGDYGYASGDHRDTFREIHRGMCLRKRVISHQDVIPSIQAFKKKKFHGYSKNRG